MLKIQNKEHYEKIVDEIKQSVGYSTILENLNKALHRYDLYGCSWFDRDITNVILGYDFAKWSFGVLFQRRQENGEYKTFMNGGLIYDDRTMSWSMHT